VSGPDEVISAASRGLPAGPARAEAVVARLRRAGRGVEWRLPEVLPAADLLDLCRRRGVHSVALARADPSLVPLLQIGGWFAGGWRLRLARRAALRAPGARLPGPAGGVPMRLDAAFWDGVRTAATPAELARLTRSRYVVLAYHRIAGEPGDERLDLSPALFAAQLRLLRVLRFHALSPGEMLAFHAHPGARLPRRSYVITADDGFPDAARALSAASDHHPQLFVPTRLAGSEVGWAPGVRLATWDELARAAAAGVAVGSHSRTHPALDGLAPDALRDELAGSLDDLRRRLPAALPVLAYPHGRSDPAARRAAAAAGYRAAYTTTPGANGAGADTLRLSRIGVKAWDGTLSFLWKAATGEHVPASWDRWRLWLHRRGLTREVRRTGAARR
jgi:peptidoglycan/xylan/chitin deacetylase (PgdA/CDA1 family)